MAYDSTRIEGIVIGARNLAWIEETRIKVIQVVKGWDGRKIDLAEISERIGTTKVEDGKSAGRELRHRFCPIEY